jgi:hypothetical protein
LVVLTDVHAFDVFRLNQPWRRGAWMIGGQDAIVDHALYRGPTYIQRLSRFVERHLTTLLTFPVTCPSKLTSAVQGRGNGCIRHLTGAQQ